MDNKSEAVIGPEMKMRTTSNGAQAWYLQDADGNTSTEVYDKAILHRWLHDNGYTRFRELDQWKIFFEDPGFMDQCAD